jgi:hypothetical protein
LALLFTALSGCAQAERQPQPPPRRAAAPIRYQKPPAPARGQPTPKPVETTDEYRNRHPSMWKRKLKAAYT